MRPTKVMDTTVLNLSQYPDLFPGFCNSGQPLSSPATDEQMRMRFFGTQLIENMHCKIAQKYVPIPCRLCITAGDE